MNDVFGHGCVHSSSTGHENILRMVTYALSNFGGGGLEFLLIAIFSLPSQENIYFVGVRPANFFLFVVEEQRYQMLIDWY